MFKVQIINVMCIGQRCGYGEGKNHEEAVTDAIKKAGEGAYYSPQFDGVCVARPVYC